MSNKVALVLQGGGVRGAYTSGVLDLLMENKELFEEYNSSFIEYLNSDVNFKNPFKFPKEKFNELIYYGIGKYYFEYIMIN